MSRRTTNLERPLARTTTETRTTARLSQDAQPRDDPLQLSDSCFCLSDKSSEHDVDLDDLPEDIDNITKLRGVNLLCQGRKDHAHRTTVGKVPGQIDHDFHSPDVDRRQGGLLATAGSATNMNVQPAATYRLRVEDPTMVMPAMALSTMMRQALFPYNDGLSSEKTHMTAATESIAQQMMGLIHKKVAWDWASWGMKYEEMKADREKERVHVQGAESQESDEFIPKQILDLDLSYHLDYYCIVGYLYEHFVDGEPNEIFNTVELTLKNWSKPYKAKDVYTADQSIRGKTFCLGHRQGRQKWFIKFQLKQGHRERAANN